MNARLFGYWRSSSTWRVRIALAIKGVAVEHVPVNLAPAASEQRGASFRARNPLGQVPVLELDGRRMTQSMAIVELLEELVPTPPLLPRDPWARAQARRLAEIVNSGIQPVQNVAVLGRVKALGGDPDAWARDTIHDGLRALEAASDGAGPFLGGDTPGLADVFLVPQLYNARRFGVPLDGLDVLVAVDARCAVLSAFRDTHPDRMVDAPRARADG